MPYKLASPKIINNRVSKLKSNRPSALLSISQLTKKIEPIRMQDVHIYQKYFLIWKTFI